MREKRIALFILMIGLGVGLGLLYGWVINPVKYADTTPEMLRSDYKADYVLMVAEIYHSDHNVEQAAQRIALLGSLPSTQILSDALVAARRLSYTTDEIEQMDALAKALQNVASTPTPGGKP